MRFTVKAKLASAFVNFSSENQRAVVDRIVQRLAPKGYLILGHSEPAVADACPALRQEASSIFRRSR